LPVATHLRDLPSADASSGIAADHCEWRRCISNAALRGPAAAGLAVVSISTEIEINAFVKAEGLSVVGQDIRRIRIM
jgi:hypothetical protein